jgi:CUB/sushi domain-containing protein
MTSSLVFFLAFILSAECIVYQSAQIGGNGGGPYDDITNYGLQNNEHVFRLENILLWGSDEEPVRAFQGKYAILDVTRGGTQDGVFAGNSHGQNARHFVIISKKEITERAYGYYGSDLTLHGGVHLTNHLGFDVRRTSGSLDFYGAGKKVGANFTILGPIVGFYGGAGGAVDYIGVYVDPSWWPDRPSRLVMLRSGGRSFSDGDDYSFDHNIELGEPFTVRIAQLVIYYGTGTVNGLYVVYEDHMRTRIPISTGNTAGQNMTITFELGDYIKVLEVENSFGSSGNSATYCFAGMRLTVVRAASGSEEAITVGSLNDVHRTDGPIVAFYGLIQNTRSCIARLGGHKLLGSSELAKTCILPDIPDYGLMDYIPGRIGIDQTLSLSCRNTSLVAVGGTTMRCREDGIWDWEELDCKVACPPLTAPTNGYFLDMPEFLIDNVTVEAACDFGFQLTRGGMLTCVNGAWVGDEPQCTLTCRHPIPPANGNFAVQKKWHLPNDVLSFTCEDDFMANGNSLLTCMSDGNWNGNQPLCIAKPFSVVVAPTTTTSAAGIVPSTTSDAATSTGVPTPTCPTSRFQPITLDSSSEEVWSTCSNVLVAYIILVIFLLCALVVTLGFIVVLSVVLVRRTKESASEVKHIPFYNEEQENEEEGGNSEEEDEEDHDEEEEDDNNEENDEEATKDEGMEDDEKVDLDADDKETPEGDEGHGDGQNAYTTDNMKENEDLIQ